MRFSEEWTARRFRGSHVEMLQMVDLAQLCITPRQYCLSILWRSSSQFLIQRLKEWSWYIFPSLWFSRIPASLPSLLILTSGLVARFRPIAKPDNTTAAPIATKSG
eukprot:TRINITY_DN2122_c0_g1_i1.p2 TRINITY_DN2122_c0_g1~~TRINITY_DN2122_c0_g1_i1.p2  ORF type:complete len:106 (+),score=10.62 TRINITY_DN2122_c0_g1_i1:264-581(+)